MKGVETRIAPPIMAMRQSTANASASLMCDRPRTTRVEEREAAIERLAGEQHHEDQALQHQHGRVGQIHAALDQATGRGDAAEQDRDRNDRQRILARQEGDQDAGEAVAGAQRRIGLAVDGGDLEEPGKPGAGARRSCSRRRSACRPAGPAPAPRADCRRSCARQSRRSCATSARRGARQAPAATARPQWTRGPGCCRSCSRRRSAWSMACSDRRIAQDAFDEKAHDRDGDVGHEQARDGLVDAARVAQQPASPIHAAPDSNRGHRHDRD